MTKPLNCYFAFVTVEAETLENAGQVLAERLGYDENYGFPYTLDYKYPQPMSENPDENIYTVEKPKVSEPNGISIDASNIRERLEYLIKEYKEDEGYEKDEDDYTINLYNAIKAMDDGQLNALILATRDLRTWELFNELSNRILDEVIESVERDKRNS